MEGIGKGVEEKEDSSVRLTLGVEGRGGLEWADRV